MAEKFDNTHKIENQEALRTLRRQIPENLHKGISLKLQKINDKEKFLKIAIGNKHLTCRVTGYELHQIFLQKPHKQEKTKKINLEFCIQQNYPSEMQEK